MLEYLSLIEGGVKHSYQEALAKKKAVLADLDAARTYFQGEFEKNAALKYADELSKKVNDTIDRLEINKDAIAYTFGTSMESGINKYFFYKRKRPVITVSPSSAMH